MNEPDVHIADQGGGSPALVFLHYFAGSLRAWVHVVERLSGAHRCVRLDIPGFGQSRPLTDYSIRAVADVITAAIARMRLPRTVIVGHSMGGKLAMACALAQPAGVDGLVLVAPSPPSPEPMDEAERSRLLASHGDRTSAERTVRAIARRPLPPEDVSACIDDNLRTAPEAWQWWLHDGSREDISLEVGRIACPVLVLVGGEDPVIPPHVAADEVIPRLAHATSREIPGAGHLLPLEAAPEVSRAIEEFVGPLRDR